MYNEKLEALITAALADGVLTDKEKNLLQEGRGHGHRPR